MCTICSTFRPYMDGCDYANLTETDSNISGTTSSGSAASTAPVGTVAELADYLVNGYWTDNGGSAHAFDTSTSNKITVNLTGLTAEGQQLARWALEAWEAVADLQFVETTDKAQIHFQDDVAGAYASYSTINNVTQSATVNIGPQWIDTYGAEIGGYAFQTYIHEIGHALGLGHLGDYDGGAVYGTSETFANDSWQMSVMSYFSQYDNTSIDATWAEATTTMLADIAAIQSIYGAPGAGSLTNGATVYGKDHTLGDSWLGRMFDALNGSGSSSAYKAGAPAMTLYDAGGQDLIDFSSDSQDQRVDLQSGAFSDVYGAKGNLAIAEGTVIEDYTAGAGDDTITGNAANNTLRGGDGNDMLNGGKGDDVLDGGAGNDILNGGMGGVKRSNDDGGDTFIGGAGIDTVTYVNAAGRLKVDLMDPSANSGVAAGDSYSGVENLIGSRGHDVLNGDDGDNRIDGGKGSDKINGRGGDDTLIGDVGNDKLTGGAGADVLNGGAGRDRAQYKQAKEGLIADLGYARVNTGEAAGDSYIGIEDLFGSRYNDRLRGDDGNNKIWGGLGDDIFHGRDGDDTLIGAGGNDTFYGGAGNDLMRGGGGADVFVFDGGRDLIADFRKNDDLRLDDALWSGNLSRAEIMQFASVTDGNTVFDFGGGDTLTLKGFTDLARLEAELMVI